MKCKHSLIIKSIVKNSGQAVVWVSIFNLVREFTINSLKVNNPIKIFNCTNEFIYYYLYVQF